MKISLIRIQQKPPGNLWMSRSVRWRKNTPFPTLNRTSGGNSFTASFTSLRCTISARIPPDACLAVRQSHPEKLGDAGMSPKMPGGKLKFKRFKSGMLFQIGVISFGDCWWMRGRDRTFQFTDTKSALITNFFTPFFLNFGFFPDC